VVDATLDSLNQSDAKGEYAVHRQRRENDKKQFFVDTMRMLCSRKDIDWILRLEDDTLVNKHLIHNVCTWPVPHAEYKFGVGFLSVTDPILADSGRVALGENLQTRYRNCVNGVHFGGGMLWSRELFKKHFDEIAACIFGYRGQLAPAICTSKVFLKHGLRSYWHIPSIVKIDTTLPRFDGKVVGEAVYGTQPFDPEFRR
jgi:hypothetical protein